MGLCPRSPKKEQLSDAFGKTSLTYGKKIQMEDFKDLALSCGADSLYYFAQSNENYIKQFYALEDQLDAQMKLVQSDPYAYAHSSMIVTLNKQTLQYLNKVQGVYWFRDVNEYFKIGLLHPTINSYQHAIQIQLQGKGIYTVGMKALVAFINETLLYDMTTGLFEISRGDINAFVQYDFGFVTKKMFVSKKKNYQEISEFGNANRTQTMYVGKKPFLLRLYDKKLELSKSDKKEMMEDYFLHCGFDLTKHISNIEFEMHRVHFKKMNIRTLDEFFANIENLFKHAMSEIRLVDLSTITQKDIQNNSKNRAKSLPIWEYIKENFSIDTFMQYQCDLQRVAQKRYTYDISKFVNAMHELINKALLHKLPINSTMITQIVDKAIEIELEAKEKPYLPLQPLQKMINKQCDVFMHNKDNELIARYKLTKEKQLIAYQLPFALLGTKELEYTIKGIEKHIGTLLPKEQIKLSKHLNIARNELKKRYEVKDAC